jgi:NodT family efflux transporter outer membrane factor (OMF) lipoprotein
MQDLSRLKGRARRLRLATTTVGVAALVAGCTLGPDFLKPKAPVEKAYEAEGTPNPPSPGKGEPTQHFALGKKIAEDWWTLFHSKALEDVLQQAIDGNRTVAAGQANLAQAHEVVNAAAGGLYPHVGFQTAAERQRFNFAALGINGFPPAIFDTFTIGPSISYDLDPFGGIKRKVEQQAALAEAEEYRLDGTYLTVTGNVVTQAVAIASIRAQMAAVNDIIASDVENLRLVDLEFKAGEATQIDIESATSHVATDRTLLPPLRQQLSVARHALAVLSGKSPADWTPPDFDLAELTLPEEVPVTLPSELVHQRPDIMAAEAQLHAATAGIAVATIALYPDLTLSATIGQSAARTGQIFVPASNVWSIASQLTAPIFEGGTLEAQKQAAEHAFDATYANYQQTVLTAFGQIADLLQALNHDAELLEQQQLALQSAESSLRLVRKSYSVGAAGLLQVLDAQRLFQQARLGFVQAQAQRYLDTVQLFVAMGGGWEKWREQAAKAEAK